MQNQPHALITIIGPIGSGKTTIAHLLSEELHLPLIDADLYEENPFLSSYVQDTPRWSFATELFFTIQRIKKLSTLPRLLQKSPVIVDSGLIMSSQVYAKNHLIQGTMTAAEWDFYHEIINDYQKLLPEPNLIIYLQADVQTQRNRIKKRGRSFETGYQLSYLSQITDRLEEFTQSIDPTKTRLTSVNTQKINALTKPGKTHLIKLVKEFLADS